MLPFIRYFLLVQIFLYASYLHAQQQDTMYVSGPLLYSAAGEPVVLRGVNEMFVWSNDKTGDRLLPEIAQSGSNCVRLVWLDSYGNPEELIELIDNTIAYKMIAMPECHDATGDWGEDLWECIYFWKDPVLIEGIQRNRRWTLLNIANEAGNGTITDQMFLDVYLPAIDSLRSWGYTVPIVIDASKWGQNLDQIGRTGRQLLEHDPLKNVMFATHSYWDRSEHIDNYEEIVRLAQDSSLVIIVGEGPSITRFGDCEDEEPLPYVEGMKILEEGNIGWLNWSWGGVKNQDCDEFRYFDFTVEGEFGSWQTVPGANVIAHDPNSIMRTSYRPASFYNESVDVSGIYLYTPDNQLSVGDSMNVEILVAPVNATDQNVSFTYQEASGVLGYDSESSSIIGLKQGSAWLKVESENGFSWEKFITVSGALNLNSELSGEKNFKVYPNPALNDRPISIEFPKHQWDRLEIITIDGQMLYSEKLANSERVILDGSHLPAGLLMIRMISAEETFTTKLLIR